MFQFARKSSISIVLSNAQLMYTLIVWACSFMIYLDVVQEFPLVTVVAVGLQAALPD